MLSDRYAGEHSSHSDAAVRAFERAVDCLALHRSVSTDLGQALDHDPNFVAAHAMAGICAVLAGRAPAMERAVATLSSSRTALAKSGGGTAGERALVEAHALAVAGQLRQAALVLEQHADLHPRDFLSIKLAHALRFMVGEPRRMLQTVTTALPHWSARSPGYGFLVGCQAFALEETGDLAAAELAGRTAIELQPGDVWGLHALAHVLEMGGRTREGRKLLRPRLQLGQHSQGFTRHLVWHLALFNLADGGEDEALALFDTSMTPVADEDFRDMANAVSLLWRLEQQGVDVGSRWQQLGDIADRHRGDCTYVFSALHDLMALLRTGRRVAAADLVAKLRITAIREDTDQARVAGRVGVSLAGVLAAACAGGQVRSELMGLAARFQLLGGSHAQRDVFLRTLMEIAADGRDTRAFGALADIRAEFRHTTDLWHAGLALKLTSSQSIPAQRQLSTAAFARGMALS